MCDVITDKKVTKENIKMIERNAANIDTIADWLLDNKIELALELSDCGSYVIQFTYDTLSGEMESKIQTETGKYKWYEKNMLSNN